MSRKIAPVIIILLLAGFSAAQQAGTAPANDKQKVLWDKFDSVVRAVDQNLDGVMGIAIEDLTTGRKYFLHEDEVFAQASSIKIAVLAELYHQAQLSAEGVPGKAKLSDVYIVDPKDLVQDSDILLGLTPGVSRITNRDLATMVAAVSDNSAANILIDRLGMANVNALMDNLGLTHTRLQRKMMDVKAAAEGRENISTPREMMTLLEQIYRGKVLNKANTTDFLKMLSTHKESYIARDLPDGLQVADKPGQLEGVRNDLGIVFAQNRPFVICVMTAYLRKERDGEQAITQISAVAYRMFDRLGRASEYGRVVSPNNSTAH